MTPDAFIATTAALSVSIRVLGGSIGYSIYYNVFANKLNAKLPLLIGESAVAAGLPLASAEEFVISYPISRLNKWRSTENTSHRVRMEGRLQ